MGHTQHYQHHGSGHRRRCRLVPIGFIAVVGMGSVLSGCGSLFSERGYFRDRSMDYKTAVEYERYRFGDLDKPGQESRVIPVMPVPTIEGNEKGFVPEKSGMAPRPQVIELVAAQGRLQILRSAEQRWAWVEAEPAATYVWMSQLLTDQEFPPAPGSVVGQLLRTQWHKEPKGEKKGSFWSRSIAAIKEGGGPPLVRYVVRFVPTQDRGLRGTEVWVKKQIDSGSSQLDDDSGLESAQSVFPALDWWRPVAKVMGQSLEAQADKAVKSELSKGVSASLRQDGNGLPLLSLDRSFAPSWEAIGQALKGLAAQRKEGLVISDLDRSLGVYFIAWSPEEREPTVNYQLHLAAGESGVLISVQVDDDTVAPAKESRVLLAQIKTELDRLGER